jgi:tRNA-dihydrouridine synthase B
MRIGNVELLNPYILAPMAGVTDLPFRLLCKEQGAGLLCMEMISAKALQYKNKNTKALLAIHPDEYPVSLQLFGSDPYIISEMAKQIEELPFQILDINMGCPVPKVVKNGEGSALMKDPKLVGRIVGQTVRAIQKPVTVKIRKGFDDAHVNAVEIAKAAEEAGAAAVAVHGRTREQYYSGRADWDIIRQVKEAVAIPVIGNGDVVSGETARAMMEQTGCDGVMIGRAAQGNPWIFSELAGYCRTCEGQALEYCRTGAKQESPPRDVVKAAMLRHARLQIEFKGDYIGIREMRKHVAWYTKGMDGAAKLRDAINRVESYEELEELLDTHL